MTIRSDLEIVKIYVQKKWYEVLCEQPKVEVKHSINKRIACNNHNPYEINPGEEEVSVEIPGVAQHQKWIFANIMMRQKTGKMLHRPVIIMYSYNAQGKLNKDYHLQGFYVESISQEGNEPVDVKGGAIDPVKYN